jgi:hypothetical protein
MTTQMQQLKPGDVLQRGDLISENRGPREQQFGCPKCDRISHTPRWDTPSPIADFTYGRTILAADLCNAKYFRP